MGPIFNPENDGHQQLSHFDVLSLFKRSIWGPHRLRKHRASVHDAVVKQPATWGGKPGGIWGGTEWTKMK